MIELTDVRKAYPLGDGAVVHALAGISLRVEEGETVSIVGSNGSGKTSLLKCIAGMLAPDSGEARIAGKSMSQMSLAERGRLVGIVFQNPADGVAAHLTVAENIALGLLRGRQPGLRPLIPSIRNSTIRNLLSQLGSDLQPRLYQRAGTLSGGQRQSLALLTTVAGGPKILLLDEHTASLDPDSAEGVLTLTSELARRSDLTVLTVTHRLDQALAFGERLLVLDRGGLVVDLKGDAKRLLTLDGLLGMLRSCGHADLVRDSGLTVGSIPAKQETKP